MSFIRRRKGLTILSLVGVIALAGVAYAYFSSTGTGTGSATVGTSTALTVTGTSASTLYPGTTSSISFTVSNPGTGHEQLTSIQLASVKACVGSGSSWNGSSCSNSGTEATTCESVETGATDGNTANFWMPNVSENQDVAGGASNATVTNNGTLTMNDLSSNQDACKNANLTLNFTTN